jgi:hypothetical protein
MFDVGDERVRVGGHVRAEEARPVRDWVCHGGERGEPRCESER